MIINHKHRFIFLKTRKTAGTSIEIALSRCCHDNDVITPISEEDEQERRRLGLRGPQNFNFPLRTYNTADWRAWLRKGRRKRFYNHAEAALVLNGIGKATWDSYFKFCFERNPFDKAISRYYWSTRDSNPRPAIGAYLKSAPVRLLSNWDVYTLNDEIAVDFVGRYEQLERDFATIKERLGLPGDLSLPRAKGGHRAERAHYSQVLDAAARARIEVVCAKEIAEFGYRWSEPPD